MSETYVIELADSTRQTIDAACLSVESGHLLAYRWTNGDVTSAWAPGVWRRFWPNPHDSEHVNLRRSLHAYHLAMAEAKTEEDRRWFEVSASIVQAAIDENERLAA